MKKSTCLLLGFFIFVNLTGVKAEDNSQTNVDTTTLVFAKEFIWSASTNNLSLGFKFLNRAERKTGQPDFFSYLLDVGTTNANQLWLGPPQFQRVEYYLYDSSHKAVSYSAAYHPANKTYKTISEVPKNVHNVRMGLILPSRKIPQPYDEITLTNIFRLVRGGDYKLVVKGRIMKINDDGSLSIMEFPPVSLLIHFRDEDVSQKSN